MIFNLNKPPKPNYRTRKRFLLFPRTIHGIRRWLEWAEWEDRLTGGGGWDDGYHEFYVPNRWLDIQCDHVTPRPYKEYRSGHQEAVNICHCGKIIKCT